MTFSFRAFRRLPLALAIAATACVATAQDAQRLPQLGSSANALLTTEEARQIGASMLFQMRALDMLTDDPLLDRYINELGYRLVAHAGIQKGMRFTFFVVRDSEINAFAAPGGYIGVNAGLITATENESELASVLAHEIAHVTQHHLERAEEDARKMSPLLALAMLGAVVASTQGAGDAGPAAVASGMGLIAQRQINFTRKDEAEADRIGINTLAAAGFDVDGMARFFGRMDRLMRPGSGGMDVPEFLRTHPVNTNRISDAKALAYVIHQKQAREPRRHIGEQVEWTDSTAPLAWLRSPEALKVAGSDDGTDYRLMRERARVLSAPRGTDMLAYYRNNLAHTHEFDNDANRYGYALALTRANQGDKALKELAPLLQKKPLRLALELAQADAELRAGRRQAALDAYVALAKKRPADRVVAGAYADALLSSGSDAKDARKAADLLRSLLDENVDDPALYRTYGNACERSGQHVRAAEAFADATYLSGHATDALNQLQRLLKRNDLDYYERARIQARIEFITPIALELARRGISADRQGR